MQWLSSLNADPMPWLLEADPANPGVRYLALTQLLDRPADDPEVVAARQAVMASGPVPPILTAQAGEGYWVQPGSGYYPKYRGTVWQVPEAGRTPVVRAAIQEGIRFLLGRDPAKADYPAPYATKPSRSWFQFGYPIAYVTDVLQNLEALTALGCGRDPRLTSALELVLSKQDALGRWKLEYTYNGKTWADVEEKGRPSKWVTLRALRVLKNAARA